MSIIEWVAAVQFNGPESQPSNPPAAAYFVVAVIAAVMGFVVWIFIRSSARRSKQ
jgi:ammonia channel protein AmtB